MRRILPILILLVFQSCFDGFGEDSGEPFFGEGTSQGGSLARFSIVGDHLYVVNDFNLVPIDISDLQNPVVRNKLDVGFGIETIFPYGDNLFIGSASAVYIYSISDRDRPTLRSTYWHSTGCDPVVVNGDYAYVTLREGSSCGNFFDVNILDVVDVSDLNNPFQVNSLPMQNPRGLGVGCNGKLYVCDGPRGLVQFDIEDPAYPIEERVYGDYHANDVIIKDDLLILTGEDGVYQFSCATDSLQMLGFLPIYL